MEKLTQLEKPKGTLRILAHINEKGNTRISDIIRETGLPSRTTYAALGRLIELGLITQELSEEFPSKKYYTLTEHGAKMAIQIEVMRGILRELGKK